MSDWKPIESAPRDGTSVLIAWDAPTSKYKAVGAAMYENDSWLTLPGYYLKTPTHWQPLPEPPND